MSVCLGKAEIPSLLCWPLLQEDEITTSSQMVERLTLQVTEFEDNLQELADQNQSLRNRNSLLAQEMEAVQEEVGGDTLCLCCARTSDPAVLTVSILTSRFHCMCLHRSQCVCVSAWDSMCGGSPSKFNKHAHIMVWIRMFIVLLK